VYSFTVDFFMEDAQFNGPIASVQYDAPEISPRVVEEGAVMAYFREQETWTALPYTYGVESADLPAVDRTVTLGLALIKSGVELHATHALQKSRRDLVVVEGKLKHRHVPG
jgi:hypothetical protein